MQSYNRAVNIVVSMNMSRLRLFYFTVSISRSIILIIDCFCDRLTDYSRLNVAALNHGVACKPGSESQSHLVQPAINHAFQDMERPPNVVVQRDGTAEPKLVFVPSGVGQPGVTLIPTVGYYTDTPARRARKTGARNGRGAGGGPSDLDLLLYGPARGCKNRFTSF